MNDETSAAVERIVRAVEAKLAVPHIYDAWKDERRPITQAEVDQMQEELRLFWSAAKSMQVAVDCARAARAEQRPKV